MSDNKQLDKNHENSQSPSSNAPAVDDPPPPYTPYGSSNSEWKPPAPSNPPALSNQPVIVTTPSITRRPDPRETNEENHSICGIFKAVCCIVLCCPWIACVSCISTCCHMCPEPKPRQNQ